VNHPNVFYKGQSSPEKRYKSWLNDDKMTCGEVDSEKITGLMCPY
jgi:hypothetical protein